MCIRDRGYSNRNINNNKSKIFTGIISGILNGLTTLGGMPVALFLLVTSIQPAVIRGSLAALFFITDIYAFIISLIGGIVDVVTIYRVLPLIIILPIGVYIGDKFFVKSKEEHYRKAVFYFLILMFIGGCSASTTCGLKVFRFQILISFVDKQIKQIFYPNGIFPIRYNNQVINDRFLTSVLTFVCLYIFVFFTLTLLLSLTGLDLITSVSSAATSISNVGPGLGPVVGPGGNFFTLTDSAKWLLSLGMLLGRLELFTVLVLFLPSFWRN